MRIKQFLTRTTFTKASSKTILRRSPPSSSPSSPPPSTCASPMESSGSRRTETEMAELWSTKWLPRFASAEFSTTYIFGQYGDLVRYIIGPIPSIVCFGQVVMKNAISTQIILYISASPLIKYIFIFWIKNPAAVDDGFWSRFLTLWINGFSFVFNFVIFFLPGRQPLFFYICANTDPRQDQLLPKKPFGLLEMLSLLLHIAIKIRILVYKTKVGQPSLVSSCFMSLKKSTVAPNFDKHSIANFSTNIFNVIIFSVVVVVISKVNSLSPPQINDYPNYLYVYIHQFISG